MKCLRSIENKIRRNKIRNEVIRQTAEVQELKYRPTTVKIRLKWFSHLKRTNEIRIPRRTLEMKVKGVGRPRTTWLDQVRIDLKEQGHDWGRIQEEELWQDSTLWRMLCSETTHN